MVSNNNLSDLPRLSTGMEVVSSDGQRVGQVKEVRERAILIERALLLPDVDLPITAIREVTGGRAVLTVAADRVDDLWWAHAGEDAQVDTKGQYD